MGWQVFASSGWNPDVMSIPIIIFFYLRQVSPLILWHSAHHCCKNAFALRLKQKEKK